MRRRTAEVHARRECRDAGMGPEANPRSHVVVELMRSSVDIIISPLLNGPDADEHVFDRGPRLDESWLSTWNDLEEEYP